ncbi:MAG: hypothetical protein HQL86_02680 [Magnetococcales bacterium]|nr:hypothetical protein [Magnetococcales bacterium]
MDKRLILAGLIGWMMLQPVDGWSFVVGEIAVQSSPGKKFQAEIPLRLVEGESLKLVKLGSKADYKVMGLNRASALNNLRVETVGKDGETRIRLTSDAPVNPKGFDLLLRVTSTKQTNFPVFRIAGSTQAKPETSARDQESAASPEAKTGVELKKSEIKPAIEAKTAEAKPAVEARAEEARSGSDAKAASKSTKGQAVAETLTTGGKQYGPVKEGDTLTSIARGLVSSRSVTIYQIMAGIYERNPEHFLLGNMNNLISGGMLTIPTVPEARAIPDRWARAMCLAHTKAWEQTLAGQNVPPPPQTALLASASPEAGKIAVSESKGAASGREDPLILSDTTPPRAQLQSHAPQSGSGLENVLVRLQGQLGELTEVLKQSQTQQAKLDTRVASLEMARGDQDALAQRVAVLEKGMRDLSARDAGNGGAESGVGAVPAAASESRSLSGAMGGLFALTGLLFAGVLIWLGRRWNRQAQEDGLKHLLAVTAREYPELANEVIREVESRKMPFIPSIHPGKLEGGSQATDKKVVNDGDLLRNVNRLNALNPKRGDAE